MERPAGSWGPHRRKGAAWLLLALLAAAAAAGLLLLLLLGPLLLPVLLLLLLPLLLLLLCRRPPDLGPPLPADGKAVLITGCDKGFGHALAKHLHAKGFTVFAGCLLKDRGGEGARELEGLGSERMKVLQLNVSSEEEVDRALKSVEKDLLNPERGHGRIVNITSMLGRMASPLRSSYCISKFGVEAFTDCLRQEMYRWGVAVIAVEPGNFIAATGILTQEAVASQAEEMWRQASEAVRADYGEAYFLQQVHQMKSFVSSGQRDKSLVLEDITSALSSRYPYTRYNPMGKRWWVRLQAMTHLPTALADALYID